MSVLRKIARKLGVKVSEKDELFIGLRDIGIKLFSDQKLDTRLDIMTEVLKKFKEPLFETYVKKGDQIVRKIRTPQEVIRELNNRTHILNELLNTVSIPWGRALENQGFANLVSAWSDLMAFANQTIRDVEVIVTKKEKQTDKYEIIEMLANFLVNFVWNIGFKILGTAFSHKDVSPIYVVVQQMQQPFYPGFIPLIERSRLQKIEEPPPDKPYPPRIKDEI